jgi:hypothetical protein
VPNEVFIFTARKQKLSHIDTIDLSRPSLNVIFYDFEVLSIAQEVKLPEKGQVKVVR